MLGAQGDLLCPGSPCRARTPGHSKADLRYLADRGVQTLGYLSLSEDQGPRLQCVVSDRALAQI
jgi:hypothetical protein